MPRPRIPIQVGLEIGHWVVLKDLGTRNGHVMVRVLCRACDTQFTRRWSSLRQGDSTMCATCSRRFKPDRVTDDDIGQRYGSWTVLGDGGIRDRKQMVRVRCDCGTVAERPWTVVKNRYSSGCRDCRYRERADTLPDGRTLREAAADAGLALGTVRARWRQGEQDPAVLLRPVSNRRERALA